MAWLGQCGIRNITTQPPTLEELFLRHYGDDVFTESADMAGDPA